MFFCSVNAIDAPPPTWEQLENGLVAVRTVVHGLVDYIQNHSKKGTDQQQVKVRWFRECFPLNITVCAQYWVFPNVIWRDLF